MGIANPDRLAVRALTMAPGTTFRTCKRSHRRSTGPFRGFRRSLTLPWAAVESAVTRFTGGTTYPFRGFGGSSGGIFAPFSPAVMSADDAAATDSRGAITVGRHHQVRLRIDASGLLQVLPVPSRPSSARGRGWCSG